MNKLNTLYKLLIILAFITSCQKNDESIIPDNKQPMVTFRFVPDQPYSMQQTGFAMEDTIFNSFKHRYSPMAYIFFYNQDGINVLQDSSIDHSVEFDKMEFTLPVGKYRVEGNSGIMSWPNRLMSFMSFSIQPQTIEITEYTKTIPVTLKPTCYLILFADPHEVSSTPLIIDSRHEDPHPLIRYNSFLEYMYVQPTEFDRLEFTKKDGTHIALNPVPFVTGHIYKLFVNDITATPATGNQKLDIHTTFIADSVSYF